jgi:Cof subfamily protein (haloacid dehalogenase superfamily)
MIRLLAIDLDGTLFNSQQKISPADRRAIVLAQQSGITPLVVTGRGRRGVEMGLDRIGLDLPHICSAGALIRQHRDAQPLSSRTFHRMDELRHVLDFVCEHELGLVADAPETHLWFGPDTLFESLDPLTAESGLQARTFNPQRDFDQPLLKATLVIPPVLVASAESLILRHCPSLHHTLAGERYIDMTAQGVDKGSALAIYAEKMGFAHTEIAAIGDQMIDIPMLKLAGLSAAMGNARAEVKAAADLIAPSNDKNGVAWFVEEILGRL